MSPFRLWCVWFGLLNATLASADWMLHTPGGGPMNERCPCLARELCPRVFGLSSEDFRYFGQLPVCADSRQVRCCGASLRVEVSDSHTTTSPTVEGGGPQHATDGENEVRNNNEIELSSNNRGQLPSGEFVNDVESTVDVKEKSKFSEEPKKLHNNAEVDILTSDNLNMGLTRHHKLEDTYSDELGSAEDALTKNKDEQMSTSNSERHKRKNLDTGDDTRKPRKYQNDVDKPQDFGNKIHELMESDKSNSIFGQKDNSTKIDEYPVYIQLLNSVQKSLNDAIDKFNELQTTLLNFITGTESQGMVTEANDEFSQSKSEKDDYETFKETIDDISIESDLSAGRFDQSMSSDESITFQNFQIERKGIVNVDDQENNERITDGSGYLTNFPVLDNDTQFEKSNISGSKNDNDRNIKYGDKIPKTNADTTEKALDTFQREAKMSEVHNLSEVNKDYVSHNIGKVGDTRDESNKIITHTGQSNDTGVMSEVKATQQTNAERTILIKVEEGSKDDLEEENTQLETSESIQHIREIPYTDENSDRLDGIQNYFEVNAVEHEVPIELASLQSNINDNTERATLDFGETIEESKTTEVRLDLKANNDNEEFRGVEQLEEMEETRTELPMSETTLNGTEPKNSDVVDDVQVSTKQVSLDYVTETSDDLHEMRNIDVTSVDTKDVDDSIEDDQTIHDPMISRDIEETLASLPLNETYLNENKTTEIAKESDVEGSTERETFADKLDESEVIQKDLDELNDTRAVVNVTDDEDNISGDNRRNYQESSTEISVKKINKEVDITPTEEAEDVTEIYEQRDNSTETQDTKGESGDSNEDGNTTVGSGAEVEDEGEMSTEEEESDKSIDEDHEEGEMSSEEESGESSEEDQNVSKESDEESGDEGDEGSEMENESNESNKTENQSSASNNTDNTFKGSSDADQSEDEDSNVKPNEPERDLDADIESSRILGSRSLHDRNSVSSEDNLELESKQKLFNVTQAQILEGSDDDSNLFQRDQPTTNSSHIQLYKLSVTNFTAVPGVMYVFPTLVESRENTPKTPFVVYPNSFSMKNYIMRNRKEEMSINNDKTLEDGKNGTEKRNTTNEAERVIVQSSSTARNDKIPPSNVTTHSGLQRIKIKKFRKRTRKNSPRKNVHETTNTNSTLPFTNNHSAAGENSKHFTGTNTTTEKLDNIQDLVEDIKLVSNITIPGSVHESIKVVNTSNKDVRAVSNASIRNETNVDDTHVSASESLLKVLTLEEIKAFNEAFGRRKNISAPQRPQITKDESDLVNEPTETDTTSKSPFFRRRLRPFTQKSQPRVTTTPIPLPTVHIKSREHLQRRSRPSAIAKRNQTERLMISTTKNNVTAEITSVNVTKHVYSMKNATGAFRSFKLRNSTLSPSLSNSPMMSKLVSKVYSRNVTKSSTISTPSDMMRTIAPTSVRNHSRFKLPQVVIKTKSLERSPTRAQNVSTTASVKRETTQTGNKSKLVGAPRNGSTISFKTPSERNISRSALKYFRETSLPKQLGDMSEEVNIETKSKVDTNTKNRAMPSFRSVSGKLTSQAPPAHVVEVGLATHTGNHSGAQIRNETLADLIPSNGELAKNYRAHPHLKEARRPNPIAREHHTVKPIESKAVINVIQNVTSNDSHPSLFLSKRLNSLPQGKSSSNNVVHINVSTTLKVTSSNVTERAIVDMEENTNETRQIRGKIRFQPPCQSSTTNSERPARCSTPAIKELISEISKLEDKTSSVSSGLENPRDVVTRKFFPSRLGSKATELDLKSNMEHIGSNLSPHGRKATTDATSQGNQTLCQNVTTNSKRLVRCSTPAIKELLAEISHLEDKTLNVSTGLENFTDVVIREFLPFRPDGRAVELALTNNTENTDRKHVTPQNLNDNREIIKDETSQGNQTPCQNLTRQSRRPVRCSTPAIKDLISEISNVESKMANVSLEINNSENMIRKLFPVQLGSKPVTLRSNPENTAINVSPRLINNGLEVTKDSSAHTSHDTVKHIDQTSEPTLEYGHRIMKINTRPRVRIGEMNAPKIILPEDDNVIKIILPTPTEENVPEMVHDSQKVFKVPATIEDVFVPPINPGRSGPVRIIGPVPKVFVDRATDSTNMSPLAFTLPVNLKASPFRALAREPSPQQFNPHRTNTSPKLPVNTPTFQPINSIEQMKEQHESFLRQQVETHSRGKKRKEIQQVTNRHNKEQPQFQDEIRPELKLAYNEEYFKQQQNQQELQWKQRPELQKQDEQKPLQRQESFEHQKQKLFGSQQNQKFIESRLAGRHRTTTEGKSMPWVQ